MTVTVTFLNSGSAWREAAPGAPRAVTALVLVWSVDEPGRIGEVALVPGGHPGVSMVLGRREATPDDAGTRAEWARHRPGLTIPTGPLRSPRISRDQLRFEGGSAGSLRVENVGRCPVLHNGSETQSAELAPGDVLEIRHQAVMLCAARPWALRSFAPGTPAPPLHAFGGPDPSGLVGESPAAWELRERIAFVAGRTAHVLVRGASGTGKELVAQAIHAGSPRGGRPMVSRNAATFPEGLIDAELFGNARSYPNPGMPERPGLIGEADGSTLFLDEFGELPQALQAHLLRVLDQGEYQRLGESKSRRADFRLVAATNRPEAALKEDVLARLRIRVEVPDLNDRREDVPLLAAHLLRRVASGDPLLAGRYFPDGDPRSFPRISSTLMSALVRHRYTTHIRELDALLWQAMSRSRGETLDVWEGFPPPGDSPDPLPPAPAPATQPGSASPGVPTASVPPTPSVPEAPGVDPLSIAPEVIQECLDRHGGRQEPAWRELGLTSRHVLTRLVKRYGLAVRGRGGADGEGGG
ncbi:sigma 54-interacting transcriptional regulator [Myxococcota bacterium]|nr:sigma 54-interacting transcriptional regulator [Myxococcota bacterium]